VLPLVETDASRRLLGIVEPAQTRVRTVTAWTNGRIDDLKVAADGERVRRGQTIATMYSPEIYAAHRDLLAAKEQVTKLGSAGDFARRSAERTLESARQKLRLLGVKTSDLDRMERADQPWTSIPLRSQFTGTVLERMVDEGNYVQAGTPIFRIADLSQVWVEFDAYPSDLPYIRVGEDVTFEVESIPGTTFTGEITFIDPVVDARTRTVDVRVEVANEDGALRPGMFVEGDVEQPALTEGEPIPLVVPASAVLFSGKRSLVYVEYRTPDGPVYAPRDVEVGARLGDVFPVVAGLERGEKVVTHGAFVIDSDLQIRGGESLMERSAQRDIDLEVDITPEFKSALKPVVSAYLDAQEALADDDLERAQAKSDAWLSAIEKSTEAASSSQRLGESWSGLARVLTGDVRRFANAETIDDARIAFRNLTQSLQRMFATYGNPLNESVRLAHCPMAFDNQGAEWFQRSETVDNAYFGAEMLRCGEIRAELSPDASGEKVAPPIGKPDVEEDK
jgi:Cu(I)/Ag(I) efflux system membrane fusion protein